MKSRLLLLLAAGLLAAMIDGASAQDTQTKVGVCDPTAYVHNCIKPNSDGSINVSGKGSGGSTAIIQADSSVPINISTGTTTQLVGLSAGKSIYITAWDVIAGGTGNITLEYGTGSNCGSGTTVLTGAYNLTAQAAIAKGGSLGPIFVVPAGNALCALTSASVQMSGSVSYTQF